MTSCALTSSSKEVKRREPDRPRQSKWSLRSLCRFGRKCTSDKKVKMQQWRYWTKFCVHSHLWCLLVFWLPCGLPGGLSQVPRVQEQEWEGVFTCSAYVIRPGLFADRTLQLVNAGNVGCSFFGITLYYCDPCCSKNNWKPEGKNFTREFAKPVIDPTADGYVKCKMYVPQIMIKCREEMARKKNERILHHMLETNTAVLGRFWGAFLNHFPLKFFPTVQKSISWCPKSPFL